MANFGVSIVVLCLACSSPAYLSGGNVPVTESTRDCAAHVIWHYEKLCGKQVTIEQLKRELRIGPNGASVSDVVRVLRAHGANAKPVRMGSDDLARVKGAAIFFFKDPDAPMGHLVLGILDGERNVLSFDGVNRPTQRTIDQLKGPFWDGVAILLEPEPSLASPAKVAVALFLAPVLLGLPAVGLLSGLRPRFRPAENSA